jgi:hypothetical protein
MFREIELNTFRVEVVSQDYILLADIQPRGDLQGYLNDRNWEFIPFKNSEMSLLAADRRIGNVQQEQCSINKSMVVVLSLLDEAKLADIHLQSSTRPIVIYTGVFAIQGGLHVPPDAPDEDLLDDLHDFFPVTRASIFPLRSVAAQPTKEVPLLFVNRKAIQSYHVRKKNREAES